MDWCCLAGPAEDGLRGRLNNDLGCEGAADDMAVTYICIFRSACALAEPVVSAACSKSRLKTHRYIPPDDSGCPVF